MKLLFVLILISNVSQAKTLLRCKLSSENSVVISVGVYETKQGILKSWIKNYLNDTYSMQIDPLEWYQRDVTLHPLESEDRHTYRLQKVDEKRWVLKEITITGSASFYSLGCSEPLP